MNLSFYTWGRLENINTDAKGLGTGWAWWWWLGTRSWDTWQEASWTSREGRVQAGPQERRREEEVEEEWASWAACCSVSGPRG